jgi:hypothetical protein
MVLSSFSWIFLVKKCCLNFVSIFLRPLRGFIKGILQYSKLGKRVLGNTRAGVLLDIYSSNAFLGASKNRRSPFETSVRVI